MRTETSQEPDWLPINERLKFAEQLLGMALEKLAKTRELAQALVQVYLYRYPINKWAEDAPEPLRTGAVKFERGGAKFFIIYSSNEYGETIINIRKNKYPMEGDPAAETIIIQLTPDTDTLRGYTHGVFQYQKIEYDQGESCLHTCTPNAGLAIRQFIDENFPA